MEETPTKKITVSVKTSKFLSEEQVIIEVPLNATEKEIEALAKEAMFEMIDWGYWNAEDEELEEE